MKIILPLLLLLLALPSKAEIISRNLIGQAGDIHITKSYQQETNSGKVAVKLCPTCTPYKLTLTSKTKVSRGNSSIQLEMLETYVNENRNAPMRLQFNNNTNQVIYITLERNNKEYPQ
ncbi:MAG: hypothetical protein COA78_26910 [Blastopirellula sp.]|nr:MAG: hypothetical protein COA78_26910 [Blastopirellula sp.]